MLKEIIKELIEESAKEFYQHLSTAGNEKIVFSGKFGKGKSTFLQYFFENQDELFGNDEYDYMFLDPVNYTVASNEDIFRYIKYDILLNLIEKKMDVDSIAFTNTEAASFYLAAHPEDALKEIIKFIPKVGKLLDEIANGILSLGGKIKTFKKEMEEQTEESKLLEFIKTIENQSFSIYENDIITQLIRQLINPDRKGKQNVLIIDNLDRIDPGHIFRILNIFSSHMDYHKDNSVVNKFYFHKVIIVCDINNIRNIFKNKYGQDVDFSGYIDKFYSKEIFYFQNYSQISKTCHQILKGLQIGFTKTSLNQMNKFVVDHGIFNLITALVNANQISLRELFNYCSKPMLIPKEFSVEMGKHIDSIEIYKTPILEMQILAKLVGGYHQAYEKIKNLKAKNAYVSDYRTHFQKLLYFELRALHLFDHNGSELVPFKIGDNEFNISFTANRGGFSYVNFSKQLPNSTIVYEPVLQDYYNLYMKILSEFHNNNTIE